MKQEVSQPRSQHPASVPFDQMNGAHASPSINITLTDSLRPGTHSGLLPSSYPTNIFCEVSCSHGGEYEVLLDYTAVDSRRF
jgi:hypothetical protein